MGHLGIKTKLNKSISYYSTPQSCTATHSSWYIKVPELVRLATEFGKNSQQKKPATADHSSLRVKFDSVFMKLCVCNEKSNFESLLL